MVKTIVFAIIFFYTFALFFLRFPPNFTGPYYTDPF